MGKKIKILIIDDSQLVRHALSELIAGDESMEVMAMANDPYEAVSILRNEVPDVITLDVEMPKMDGITFLRKLMSQHPIPVVVISTLTKSGTAEALKALEYGAVDVMHKPNVSTGKELDRNATYIRNAIKAAALANVRLLNRRLAQGRTSGIKQATVVAETAIAKVAARNVIAIGASTGGTEAIKSILKNLTPDSPGVVIVQHMPAMFTGQFAQRLNNECEIEVREAKHNDRVLRGCALIAPGNQHMEIRNSGEGFVVRLNESELVNRHRPSVDVLFHSVADKVRSKAIGVLLTGMGKDGAQGLLALKEAGAETIAQDEASCVVFGMPREAIRIGAASKVLSLDETGKYLGRIKSTN